VFRREASGRKLVLQGRRDGPVRVAARTWGRRERARYAGTLGQRLGDPLAWRATEAIVGHLCSFLYVVATD
jgi:hypothetical protein